MYSNVLLLFSYLIYCTTASPISVDLEGPQYVLSFNSSSPSRSHEALEVVPPRPDKIPYYDPRERGGSLLNVSNPHLRSFCLASSQLTDSLLSMIQRNPWGGGEPLNIIISGQSSPDVLRKNGLIAYSRSLGKFLRYLSQLCRRRADLCCLV